ncbi:MAG: hypothetical protein HY559_01340 [Gammaproteobacteria bacterium]|nr:hypothetical protein [Gammaproteobacteria bacterium]
MRNFSVFLIGGIFCLLSVSYAGEKENLQKAIASLLRCVTLNDVRETILGLKPLWQDFRAELEAVKALPLDTSEQLQAAQKRYEAVKFSVTKLETRILIAVTIAGYEINENLFSAEEKKVALTKLFRLANDLEKFQIGDPWTSFTRIKAPLIGLRKAHTSVHQYTAWFYIQRLEQGNQQLITWWEQNGKPAEGLEKLKSIQQQLKEAAPCAENTDPRQLEGLHLRLMVWDCESTYSLPEGPN